MVIDKKIKITIAPTNVRYYEEKGYEIPRSKDSRGRISFKKGTKITVDIKDLMPTSKSKVLTMCEICRKEKYVTYDTLAYRKNSQFLITGQTLCVSCSNKKLFTGKNNPNYIHGNNRFCEYRCNAKKRKIKFELSVDEFEKITNQECHYCGGYSSDNNIKSRGNGVDRKNSELGYSILNCVTCCATCNFVKNTMPYETFKKYITRIYERMIKNEI